ncbi:MAG TPA: CHAD domain-containing protein [Pyrinomonadaceae bacterium]|nr:CHAD domain-containing protein [Pyrinomonadaceae bacterium]
MAKAKKIEGLDCGADAAAGVRLVLVSRFDEMAEYRAAALDSADAEGVHDMRVASRRLRSALRDFRPHVRRPSRLERVRGELKKLARALGAVRDEDVATAALLKLSAEAPAEARGAVEALTEERRRRREHGQRELLEALSAEAVGRLRERFVRAVEEACRPARVKKGGGGEEESRETFAGAGRAVVARSWDELRELSTSLYRPLKTRRLHRMRIAAKRLRYSLELFTACWGAGAHELASELSELQDALGALHDCDEWIEEVGARLARSSGDGDADSGERAGLVWLLDHFAAERAASYREALRIWHEWERQGFAGRVAACAEGEGREG